MFDLSILESLKMTVFHTPAMGKVHSLPEAQS